MTAASATTASGGFATASLASTHALTRDFGGFRAVDSVDLAVRSGEVVGLLGANGAGKTTVIRLLLGLLRPSEGRALLFGRPPSRATRRRIGYVPQTLGLWPDLTVAENLAFRTAALGAAPAVLPADLVATGDRPVGELPLGLQRRAAFVAALAHSPDLLVLDEPTSGVDPLARARLWESVREAAGTGAGVLVTTHHMDEARQCDRLVLMVRGRIVAAGMEREIVADSKVVEVRGADWAAAFSALDAARLPVALAGRRVRVPGTDAAAVRAALRVAGVEATADSVAATLDEAMLVLERAAGRTDGPVREDGAPGQDSRSRT